MEPQSRNNETTANSQTSHLERQLRELGLKPAEEVEAPKRSKLNIRVICLKCGANFEKSPYNIFYKSPNGACQYCSKESKKSKSKKIAKQNLSQLRRMQIGEILGKGDLHKLSEIRDYWKDCISHIYFLETWCNKIDLEDEAALLRFLAKVAITHLHEQLEFEALIDKVAEIRLSATEETYGQLLRSAIINHFDLILDEDDIDYTNPDVQKLLAKKDDTNPEIQKLLEKEFVEDEIEYWGDRVHEHAFIRAQQLRAKEKKREELKSAQKLSDAWTTFNHFSND